jgi:cytochrome c553
VKSVVAIISITAIVAWITPAFAAGDAAAGKETYSKKCASCHGTAGEGKDSIAKMLKVELRPLASKEVQAPERLRSESRHPGRKWQDESRRWY